MAYNLNLADRVRESLSHLKKVEEKTMFRGMCFIVNGKMCICIGNDEMLCRIGVEHYEEALERRGTRAMVRGTKALRGYIYVMPEGYKSTKDFKYFVDLCLKFNKVAKASKAKKEKGG